MIAGCTIACAAPLALFDVAVTFPVGTTPVGVIAPEVVTTLEDCHCRPPGATAGLPLAPLQLGSSLSTKAQELPPHSAITGPNLRCRLAPKPAF
jgi:hypothetical protein